MAVKVQNPENIRKAKRWDEKDDSALLELMRRKIKEVTLAIRDAPSPFMRARLKAKRKHYKEMASKVADGTYNGDIIFSEMQAAAALRTQETLNRERYLNPAEARKYVSSYEDIDFDYERYFRKTRYYGRSLPILMTLLSIVLIAYFIIGAFLPVNLKSSLRDNFDIKPDVVFTFKLGPDAQDFFMDNEGDWPDGDWRVAGGVEQRLTYGEPYIDPETNEQPDQVFLYEDLGMRTIHISAFDVIKAWFATKMLKNIRLDFIEDLPAFQGASWFDVKYMEKAESDIVNLRNADGSFNFIVLLKYISGYGIILLLIACFLLTILCLILNILRVFSYTTRKFHILHILLLLFSILIVFLPAFMSIETTSDILPALKNYTTYMADMNAFRRADDATMVLNSFAFVPIVAAFLLLLLPKIFKNRLKKRPTFVPRGNRPRLTTEQQIQQIAYDNVERAYQRSARQ